MKLSKLFVTSSILLAAGFATANAGSLLGEVGGELSAGYDSDYIFRGTNLGEDAVWTGLDIAIPLTEGLDLGLGAWYINPTSGGPDNDELDLYANLATTVGGVDVGIGYAAYTYPELGGDAATNEVGLTVGGELAGFALGAGYYYDFDLETNYYEGSVGYDYAITDSLSAALSATIGFLEKDYSHTTVVFELPIALSDNATLTPYVAGVFPDEKVHGGDIKDEVFGGASLSVSF